MDICAGRAHDMSDTSWNEDGFARICRHQTLEQAKGGPTESGRRIAQTGIEPRGHRIVGDVARAELQAQLSSTNAARCLKTADGFPPSGERGVRCPHEVSCRGTYRSWVRRRARGFLKGNGPTGLMKRALKPPNGII